MLLPDWVQDFVLLMQAIANPANQLQVWIPLSTCLQYACTSNAFDITGMVDTDDEKYMDTAKRARSVLLEDLTDLMSTIHGMAASELNELLDVRSVWPQTKYHDKIKCAVRKDYARRGAICLRSVEQIRMSILAVAAAGKLGPSFAFEDK
ncbi:hypothetical protein CC86DRAFT_404907 [Ophiobolus disseminans]|uniref:Uncharacterized protein n=1 Tax=Ophiobolus disseminans TaxID=1469910 RepID=A0A6A7A407_9PLEO|nr:hypothetical protein CC86DRAFT_404907 [Ophiobolus disseminans]